MFSIGYNLQKWLLTFVNLFYILIGSCLIAVALTFYYSPKIHITKIAMGMTFVGVCLLGLSILGLYGAIKQNQTALVFYSSFMILIFIAQFALAIYAVGFEDRNLLPVSMILLGFCLLSLSILGIYGAIKQQQPALFLYSLFMMVIFISQYALAIYALGLAHRNLIPIIKKTWASFHDETKIYLMNYFKCCPLDIHDYIYDKESLYKDFSKTVYCQDYDPDKAGPDQDAHELNCGRKIEEKINSRTTIVGNVALVFCFLQIFGVWLAMNFSNAKRPGLERSSNGNYGQDRGYDQRSSSRIRNSKL